jgi:mannose-6-phosphate isomerase-like protein (cupin superfamily)
MLNRREFTLVLLTALTAGGLVAVAQSVKNPAMTSTAIEWNSVESKPNANGSGKKFFDGPSPTLEQLECHASTLKPGAANHEILKRTHDEVIIIKEGTVEAYVGDKWVKVGPGSVIFNAANMDQAIKNVGDTPATYHVVMARPKAAS